MFEILKRANKPIPNQYKQPITDIEKLQLDILSKEYCEFVKCEICPLRGNLKHSLCVEIRYRPNKSTAKRLLKYIESK